MMSLYDRNFQKAADLLFEVFLNYQDSGSPRAGKLLKYIGIMEICGNILVTKLDNRGAKAFAEKDSSA